MNAPKIATLPTLVALTDRSLGWVAEHLGRAVGAPVLAMTGRNRQLRATVALHCAQVKVNANKSMRAWKLLDTRLLSASSQLGAVATAATVGTSVSLPRFERTLHAV